MSRPVFQRASWGGFTCQGQVFDLTHLDEWRMEAVDSQKATRPIAVTFSDHCFTREPRDDDDPALVFPGSTRQAGHFCVERYHLSLGLKTHLAQATTEKVWHLGHDGYATLPTVDHRGDKVLYGIVFSLDRVTGLSVDPHMRIKSAHPRDEREITTYGRIAFAHLITLRMQGKSPLASWTGTVGGPGRPEGGKKNRPFRAYSDAGSCRYLWANLFTRRRAIHPVRDGPGLGPGGTGYSHAPLSSGLQR